MKWESSFFVQKGTSNGKELKGTFVMLFLFNKTFD